MATYTIEINNWTYEFDAQYPIILQNLVSPQEFNNIISQCNRYASKMKSAQRTNFILIFLSMILFFAALLVGILVPTFNLPRGGFPFTIFITLGIIVIYLIVIFSIVFRSRKKLNNLKSGIRSYLNQENQRNFIARGVQFLLKERMVAGNKTAFMVPYIEVVVASQMNNTQMYQQQPTYQQPTYQQPTYQQQEYQPNNYQPYTTPHLYVSPYSVQPTQPEIYQSGQKL